MCSIESEELHTISTFQSSSNIRTYSSLCRYIHLKIHPSIDTCHLLILQIQMHGYTSVHLFRWPHSVPLLPEEEEEEEVVMWEVDEDLCNIVHPCVAFCWWRICCNEQNFVSLHSYVSVCVCWHVVYTQGFNTHYYVSFVSFFKQDIAVSCTMIILCLVSLLFKS